MRTTLTLTPEVKSLVKRVMIERGASFKEVVNTAIVEGLSRSQPKVWIDTPTFDLGEPLVDLTHSGRVLARLDDADFLQQVETR